MATEDKQQFHFEINLLNLHRSNVKGLPLISINIFEIHAGGMKRGLFFYSQMPVKDEHGRVPRLVRLLFFDHTFIWYGTTRAKS